MEAMRTSTRRLFILVGTLLAAPAAHAQSWVDRELVHAPGGLCLDLQGNFDSTMRPPPGTALIVAVCNGRESQRWGVVGSESHGYEDRPRQLSSFAGSGIEARTGHAVIASGAGDADHVRDHIEITSQSAAARPSLCLATATEHPAPGERVLVRPCDGSPSQRFTISRH